MRYNATSIYADLLTTSGVLVTSTCWCVWMQAVVAMDKIQLPGKLERDLGYAKLILSLEYLKVSSLS